MTWDLAALFLVVAMVPFATLNPILYGYIHEWRKSPEGRALMNLFVSLAALVDMAVLYKFVPDFPAKPIVATVIYTAILASVVRFTAVLVRDLREQRRRT